MKDIDGRSLTKEQQAYIRRIATTRVVNGESAELITRIYGLSPKIIYKWKRKALKEGLDSLGDDRRGGRYANKLTLEEEQEVKGWIVGHDPRQYGFDFGLWTRQVVSDLIEYKVGIRLCVTAVGKLLHRIGLTPQKPLRRAYERDSEAVERWLNEDYPRIKRSAKRRGAEIFWMDEAGVRSDDPLQRSWGLKGQTPIVSTSGRRQSLNLISALNNKGKFWYSVYTGRFTGDKFIELLKSFRRGRGNKLVVIVDGHPVHKSKKVQRYLQSTKGKLRLEFLPPYAPDLNPDELVWNQLRHEGPAKRPLDADESLKERVENIMAGFKSNKALIRSFFREKSVAYCAA